jgi:hypothetical protein
MTKAERWLKETMTVRRWLVVLCAVAVLATVTAYGAVSLLRGEDAAGGDDGSNTTTTGELRPTSLSITSNVGSIGVLDGRATVSLEVFPTRASLPWTVTIRTLPGTGLTGATVREIELKEGEPKMFAAALDEVVHHPDPDNDTTVGGTTIHVVPAGAPGEFNYELKCIGTLKLDADGVADLRRMLDRAEAQRMWLLPRTVALRVPNVPPPAIAEVRPSGK